MFKPPCPYCNSRNTRILANNQIWEDLGVAEVNYRCDKCKQYFYRRFQLNPGEYKFYPYAHWRWSDVIGRSEIQLNEKRDDPPKESNNLGF